MSRLPFPPTAHDRLLGCLLGGALGDAIGLFTEFLPRTECITIYGPQPSFTLLKPGSHALAPLPPTPAKKTGLLGTSKPNSKDEAPRGMQPMHMDRHRGMFEPGSWTDDTDQALLILLAWLRSHDTTDVAARGKLDEREFARRLKVWCREGLRALCRAPLGLGRTVKASVYAKGWEEDPIKVAREKWIETGRTVAPNGAVMRTAFVGCLMFQDSDGIPGLERTFLAAMTLGAATHADPRCIISCAIVSGLVASLMRAGSKDTEHQLASEDDVRAIVAQAVAFYDARPVDEFPDKLTPEQKTELNGYIWPATLAELELDERTSIGYTFKCLGAGMWGLRRAIEWHAAGESSSDAVQERDIFERIITDLTMSGGDADTNACVAGGLVGCYLGVRGLCYRWAVGLGQAQRQSGQRVQLREWLTEKGEAASQLLGISTTQGDPYDPAADADTLVYGAVDAVALTDKEMDEMMWGRVMQGMVERLGYADDPKYNQPVARKSKSAKDSGDCIVM